MRVLALDTTTRAGSVALVDAGRVVAERSGDPGRTHAERLPGDILDLLTQYGVGTRDVDLFAVASGPGLFTGLRIGIATLQGLAFVHGRRIALVSALEALAHVAAETLGPGALAGAWMDAHRRDVFSALYRVADRPPFDIRRLEEIDGPRVGGPVAVIEAWRAVAGARPIVFIGDGAVMHETVIREAGAGATILPHAVLAGTIGRMAEGQAQGGLTLAPADAHPLYVRRPDAEIERDRRSAQ